MPYLDVPYSLNLGVEEGNTLEAARDWTLQGPVGNSLPGDLGSCQRCLSTAVLLITPPFSENLHAREDETQAGMGVQLMFTSVTFETELLFIAGAVA